MTTEPKKLAEIAARINGHLKRFEADPEINAETFWDSARTGKRESSGKPYYHAGARQAGRYVSVIYIAYQNSTALKRDEAERYLAWLDAGNVGRHYEALRDLSGSR